MRTIVGILLLAGAGWAAITGAIDGQPLTFPVVFVLGLLGAGVLWGEPHDGRPFDHERERIFRERDYRLAEHGLRRPFG